MHHSSWYIAAEIETVARGYGNMRYLEVMDSAMSSAQTRQPRSQQAPRQRLHQTLQPNGSTKRQRRNHDRNESYELVIWTGSLQTGRSSYFQASGRWGGGKSFCYGYLYRKRNFNHYLLLYLICYMLSLVLIFISYCYYYI